MKNQIPSSCRLLAFSFFFVVAGQLAAASSTLEEAHAALRAKDLPKATALLEPLTSADSKNAEAFHLLSQVRLAEKKAEEAVALAEKATALDATKPAYFAQLGQALSLRIGQVGFIQQAIISTKLKGAFLKAIELDPDHLEGLIGLTRYYSFAPEIAGGSLKKAKETALRVQRVHPLRGEIELGYVAARGERYEEALKHFEAAAQLQPGSAQVQHECGEMLVKLGRKAEARERFEAALKLNPNFEAPRKALAQLAHPAS